MVAGGCLRGRGGKDRYADEHDRDRGSASHCAGDDTGPGSRSGQAHLRGARPLCTRVERGRCRNLASERRGGVPQELDQRRVGPFGGFDEKRRVVDLEVSITITGS